MALESLRSISVPGLGPQSGRLLHLGLCLSLSNLTILNVWERWNGFALSRKVNINSAQSKVSLRFLNITIFLNWEISQLLQIIIDFSIITKKLDGPFCCNWVLLTEGTKYLNILLHKHLIVCHESHLGMTWSSQQDWYSQLSSFQKICWKTVELRIRVT